MLIGLWNYHEVLNKNNFMLSSNTKSVLGEDILQSFYEFCLDAKSNNHEFKILNVDTCYKKYDLFIFFNYPNSNKKYVQEALQSSKPKYLFNLECPTIYPETWDKNVYGKFNKIFTWDDSLVDNKKFFKINAPSYPKSRINNLPNNNKNKFCIIVGSNKSNAHANDLYRKRLEVIKWYEQNNKEDLDFYGYGWSNYVFKGSKIVRVLNKFNFLTKLISPKFKNYKGEFKGEKVNLLKNYKFSYCIENAKNYPGYITEKIFHCFFSLTVPVYLGCPNIIDHIPNDCFVDMRKFENIDNIHYFLKNMTDKDYEQYQVSIKKFLNSKKFTQFSNEYYIKTLKNNLFI